MEASFRRLVRIVCGACGLAIEMEFAHNIAWMRGPAQRAVLDGREYELEQGGLGTCEEFGFVHPMGVIVMLVLHFTKAALAIRTRQLANCRIRVCKVSMPQCSLTDAGVNKNSSLQWGFFQLRSDDGFYLQ